MRICIQANTYRLKLEKGKEKLLLNKVKFVVIGNRVVQYKTNVEKGIPYSRCLRGIMLQWKTKVVYLLFIFYDRTICSGVSQ